MAKCYLVKDIKKTSEQQLKPKAVVLQNILNFSKALEVKTIKNDFCLEVVLN